MHGKLLSSLTACIESPPVGCYHPNPPSQLLLLPRPMVGEGHIVMLLSINPIYLVYITATIAVTLNVFEGHWGLQSFSSKNFCIFFALLYKISTDKVRRAVALQQQSFLLF